MAKNKFNKGDKVVLVTISGWSGTTAEICVVQGVNKGKVMLENDNKEYDAETGKCTFKPYDAEWQIIRFKDW